ncbi:hypothetical protein B0T26DRAFT_669597 [Lasiosphaeria miniovina]|uniref:Uncharacterized protein n=1 Tax=Lasiosphaeria miniovina TaxID=1954250 RepID=A0AA40BFB1_9PEZI|nr:uncharacterized protein B0T26DRAFT_669597 [Lasiosphaeria miniovina]KAK0733164.1 hypothetical protein B0T26DRAFT_669597 [Lasiosphaeria miniovina]
MSSHGVFGSQTSRDLEYMLLDSYEWHDKNGVIWKSAQNNAISWLDALTYNYLDNKGQGPVIGPRHLLDSLGYRYWNQQGVTIGFFQRIYSSSAIHFRILKLSTIERHKRSYLRNIPGLNHWRKMRDIDDLAKTMKGPGDKYEGQVLGYAAITNDSFQQDANEGPKPKIQRYDDMVLSDRISGAFHYLKPGSQAKVIEVRIISPEAEKL